MEEERIIGCDEGVLVTGANGFIGSRVVKRLLDYGFRNVRGFVRSGRDSLLKSSAGRAVEVMEGNLLSREDCRRALDGRSVVFHLAAGRGDKTYADAVRNSVVTTRNLLEEIRGSGNFKRFVNVSSFSVYSPSGIKRGVLLDENCGMETNPAARGEAYCYGKVRQDELVMEYGSRFAIPYVIVRPGAVYGPGNRGLTSRVGIDTFGLFLHLGGSSRIPFTYVENCAEAIVLAGLKKGVDGEIFNIVDYSPPTSRSLLRRY
ncbi:MAG TPA: NAD(P)-dependent oxidoreductase, partial [Thermodesulfobacteriota bacterium]|nr:NAD(P)-dependent oxidoreductase [Thermodesulfobacteriota bacterium]